MGAGYKLQAGAEIVKYYFASFCKASWWKFGCMQVQKSDRWNLFALLTT